MFQIPSEYFRNDTVHRTLGGDENLGILSCGFLKKQDNSGESHYLFKYYGAFLLLSGEGTHVDCDGKEYRLTPGCFVQRIPGKPHATYVKPDGNWLEYFICFGRSVFESLAQINAMNAKQDVLYPGVNQAVFRMSVDFLAVLRTAPEEDLPLLLVEAQKIILQLYRMHWCNTATREDAEFVQQACRMLSTVPHIRLSTREVASHLGVGYEKFRKLFRERMGVSPGAYAIQCRINAAKAMLLEPGCSIRDTAQKLGFPDAFTFSRQFTKSVGMPPSQYKSMY